MGEQSTIFTLTDKRANGGSLLPCASRYGRGQRAPLDDARLARLSRHVHSAVGNLALVLASRVTGEVASINATLVGVAVLSPVTDLTLSGTTYETRADADPLFSRPHVAELLHS